MPAASRNTAGTFLAVINLVSGLPWEDYRISLRPLIAYLRKSHSHILNYELPAIKKEAAP